MLSTEVQDGSWTFSLNRPEKLNALSAELVTALIAGVQQAHDQAAHTLVFRGQGRGFCAGFDLSELAAQSEADLVLRFVHIELLLQAIATSPCHTVVLAHGRVMGAGVDLFAVCRQRLAAPGTSFRMPGLKFGLVLGTRRFGAIVGAEPARRILEQLSSFDVDQALAMGFVHRSLATEDWDAAVQAETAVASVLGPAARAALLRLLGQPAPEQCHADLAELVRSCAQGGLKDRLLAYAAGR